MRLFLLEELKKEALLIISRMRSDIHESTRLTFQDWKHIVGFKSKEIIMTTMKSIDSKTLQAWLDKKEAVVVDVREPDEYENMHIPGATLIPLGTIQKALLPEYGTKKLVIHCQKGVRGCTACEKLLLADPSLEVYNLEGGISAWESAGYETVSKE
jgi:rhodanese-related sulfurtransferase